MLDRNYTWHLHSANTVPYAYQKQFFSATECDAIIEYGLAQTPIESYVGEDRSVDNNIRRNRVCFLRSQDQANHWIFSRISDGVRSINQQFWNFDLDFIETLQFTRYDRDADFYGAHVDMGYGKIEQRKLSVSIQLSDETAYTGSDLQFHNCGMNFYDSVRERGTIIMFPSWVVHQVTPISSGTRYSLVGWVIGPPFK